MNLKIFFIFSICFLLFHFSRITAEEKVLTTISTKIDSLGKLSADDFETKYPLLQKEIKEHLKNKLGVCRGELNPLIEQGSQAGTACFKELNDLETKYIENEYEARKRYLIHLHQKQLVTLQSAKDKALKEIQESKKYK